MPMVAGEYWSDEQFNRNPYTNPNRHKGYVYLMRTREKVVDGERRHAWKIGISKDVDRRCRNLHGGWLRGCRVDVVASVYVDKPRQLERELHKRFRTYHINREWFDLDNASEAEMTELFAALGATTT